MTLVVIHRDKSIEIAPSQHQIGAERTLDVQARGLQPPHCGNGNLVVITPEQSALARMRVDSEQPDARLLDIQPP